MPDSTVFPIVEWMDLVDIASTNKELLRRLDEEVGNNYTYVSRGKVVARPNWVDSELNTNDPERSDAASKVWNAWKRLQFLKFNTDFTFEKPKGREPKIIHQLETQLYELRDEYYKEALDTDMSDVQRAEYRHKATQIVDSRQAQHPEKAVEISNQKAEARAKTKAKTNRVVGSGFKIFFKIIMYPFFLMLIVPATGIYITLWALLFAYCLVVSPFYWLFGDKDFNPVMVTQTMMYAAWGYIKMLTVGYWKND